MRLYKIKTILVVGLTLSGFAHADFECSGKPGTDLKIKTFHLGIDESFHSLKHMAVALLKLNGEKTLLQGTVSETHTRVGTNSAYTFENKAGDPSSLKVTAIVFSGNCHGRAGCTANPFPAYKTTFNYLGIDYELECIQTVF